ncbi:MAG: hypothetical protein ACJ71B_11940, partial [Nitrososphaera sp.]
MSANNGQVRNEGAASAQAKDSSSPTASGTIRQTPEQDRQPSKLSSSLDKNNPTKASQPPAKGAAAASTKPVAATPPAKKEPEPPPFEKGLV